MNEIFIHVVGVVLGAFALRFLGLNKKVIVTRAAGHVGWFWKTLRLGGKFIFFYGLLVFISNLMVNGAANFSTVMGISMLTFGFIFWIIGAVVISIKEG